MPVDYSNQDISYTDLSGANLSGGSFTNTNATGVNFTNANLSSANFTGATITLANFRNALITGATINTLTFSDLQKGQLLMNSSNHGITAINTLTSLSLADFVALNPSASLDDITTVTSVSV